MSRCLADRKDSSSDGVKLRGGVKLTGGVISEEEFCSEKEFSSEEGIILVEELSSEEELIHIRVPAKRRSLVQRSCLAQLKS